MSKSDLEQIDNVLESNGMVKYPDGNRVLIGCPNGKLFEYSVSEKKTVHEYEKLYGTPERILLAPNKRSFFATISGQGLYQFDLNLQKCFKKYKDKSINKFVVTHDGRYLITYHHDIGKLCIRLTRNEKLIQSVNLYKKGGIYLMLCSYDDKFVFIGDGNC